jgi:hypothetical protein
MVGLYLKFSCHLTGVSINLYPGESLPGSHFKKWTHVL